MSCRRVELVSALNHDAHLHGHSAPSRPVRLHDNQVRFHSLSKLNRPRWRRANDSEKSRMASKRLAFQIRAVVLTLQPHLRDRRSDHSPFDAHMRHLDISCNHYNGSWLRVQMFAFGFGRVASLQHDAIRYLVRFLIEVNVPVISTADANLGVTTR